MTFRLAGTLLVAGAALAIAAITLSTAADARTFRNPHLGGKRLDGCYSWPGPCKSRRAAKAFCREKGYETAVDYGTSNELGIYQTRRIGDGGVCTASCTVMKFVVCVDGDEFDDDY